VLQRKSLGLLDHDAQLLLWVLQRRSLQGLHNAELQVLQRRSLEQQRKSLEVLHNDVLQQVLQRKSLGLLQVLLHRSLQEQQRGA
jgi:hypothetical protein